MKTTLEIEAPELKGTTASTHTVVVQELAAAAKEIAAARSAEAEERARSVARARQLEPAQANQRVVHYQD